ncbi:MAG: acetyl-CoA carboxylase biotin carboxylase subunit [Candidatus Krumholzibacteriota bacterium]|nr:acetyl-CoA carboxylase biotin carboxylase subunit [Candidatus Krumholzibacteriota bacterium]
MFEKVLVAARGEIALRIIRACRELDVKTVAVHSVADVDSLHVKLADEDVSIGPAPSEKSYLNIPAIIAAAEITNADAVHPGYGFLSENPDFAEICMSCGIGWIGPPPELMKKMGDKSLARELMKEAGLPVIPGSKGEVESADKAVKICDDIGYPVMVKAVAGGGGRGIRIIRNAQQIAENFHTATVEAKGSFGYGGLYIEKYLENPRHIEVQILGDGKGGVIIFGERECSIQRRHQKLLEESPSPGLNDLMREKLSGFAVRGAEYIKYGSLGTVEFLVDSKDNVYFLEMNTRVQVEHPVTEMVTNVDLIREQIRQAFTGKLLISQDDVHIEGWAIECRINAEDPDRNFIPVPGKITFFHPPGGPGVRVDSHIYTGYVIPPNYDSLLAKVIVWGSNREKARKRMIGALDEFIIEGVPTTISFLEEIMRNKDFAEGKFDTTFLDKMKID